MVSRLGLQVTASKFVLHWVPYYWDLVPDEFMLSKYQDYCRI